MHAAEYTILIATINLIYAARLPCMQLRTQYSAIDLLFLCICIIIVTGSAKTLHVHMQILTGF